MPTTIPIARSPLADWHTRAGATLETRDGWQVAVHYSTRAADSGDANLIVDRACRATFEINGPETGTSVASLCGRDVPLRRIHSEAGRDVYRLTPTRAIVIGNEPSVLAPLPSPPPGKRGEGDMIDVTGGWATISLIGPDAERILNKVTAVDLRERTVPVGGCCQGPIFGVNTLFGRFADRFDLHVCTDSAEFFWEVLLDAGAEFGLRPAGTEDA